MGWDRCWGFVHITLFLARLWLVGFVWVVYMYICIIFSGYYILCIYMHHVSYLSLSLSLPLSLPLFLPLFLPLPLSLSPFLSPFLSLSHTHTPTIVPLIPRHTPRANPPAIPSIVLPAYSQPLTFQASTFSILALVMSILPWTWILPPQDSPAATSQRTVFVADFIDLAIR
jgi:hypothetical protein